MGTQLHRCYWTLQCHNVSLRCIRCCTQVRCHWLELQSGLLLRRSQCFCWCISGGGPVCWSDWLDSSVHRPWCFLYSRGPWRWPFQSGCSMKRQWSTANFYPDRRISSGRPLRLQISCYRLLQLEKLLSWFEKRWPGTRSSGSKREEIDDSFIWLL